jgi:hypothetical protein
MRLQRERYRATSGRLGRLWQAPAMDDERKRRSNPLLRDEWSNLRAPLPTAAWLLSRTNLSSGRHATPAEEPLLL